MHVTRESFDSGRRGGASLDVATRGVLARYGFALAVTLGSIAVSLAVLPASDTPVLALAYE